MSTPDGEGREPEDREPEDWFGDEEHWQEPPREEKPPAERGRLQLPPAGSPGRRRLVIAALVGALVLILAVVALVEAGGDDEAEPQIAPPPATDTGPSTTTTPTTTRSELELAETGQIAPGDSGARVRRLQAALNALGYDVGEPDGEFGAQTQEAVSAFQEEAGLEADGVAGPETLAAINEALRQRGR